MWPAPSGPLPAFKDLESSFATIRSIPADIRDAGSPTTPVAHRHRRVAGRASVPRMPTLDLDFVRAQFPSFSHPETGEWAHLENAGGSYCPRQVVDLLTDLFAHGKCQPEWDFGPSVMASQAMARSRTVMAELFNAAEDEIHFGPSTSQNTYVLAKAMRPMWEDGDEIIVTNQDHEANSGAWRRLADTGIVVKEWRVDPETGLLDPAALDALITDRTRLLAVTHASNIAATINPGRDLADRIHAVGGHIVIDGVSYAPHALPDVAALDCDVYLYSTYKTYGPHLGLMYTRQSLLEQLDNQSHYFKDTTPEGWLTQPAPITQRSVRSQASPTTTTPWSSITASREPPDGIGSRHSSTPLRPMRPRSRLRLSRC